MLRQTPSKTAEQQELEDFMLALALSLQERPTPRVQDPKESDAALAARLQQQAQQAEDDAELARLLSMEQEAPMETAEERARRFTQEEEDAKFAANLQEEWNITPAYHAHQRQTPVDPNIPTPKFPEITSLEKICEEVGTLCIRDENIHLHTRRLGVLCHEALKLEKPYQLSFEGDIKSEFDKIVRPEIEDWVSTDTEANQGIVKTILNSIAAKGSESLEPETGLNMMSFLVKSWHLAKQSGVEENKAFIIHNLKHNIEAGGGCDAGIAARLVQPYTNLLLPSMQNACGWYESTRVRMSYN